MADEAAAAAVEIPPELVTLAKTVGWPEALLGELLQRGAQQADLIRYMSLGVTADQVRQFLASADAGEGGGGPPAPQLDLAWMRVPTEWGTRAKPTKSGLTIDAINVGKYGDVPDTWEYQTEMPRGAVPILGVEGMGYSVYEKQELWADNAGALYEEAIQRRWRPATDIAWDQLKPLPEDLERAQCQISTFLTEVEMIASDFPAKWLWQMNQHFHEVKMFLCTQAMDEARHLEVFRKRALANGGGLMRCLTGTEMFLRTILHAPTYIQGSFLMHVLGEGLVLDIFRGGEFLAKNKTEKEMYRLCMQDEARHVSYGTMHLKYFLEHHPEREKAIEEMHALAEVAELGIPGFLTNPFIIEPLAVLMGDGVQGIDKGMEAIRMVWVRMREEYLNRCAIAGFDRRDVTKVPELAPF